MYGAAGSEARPSQDGTLTRLPRTAPAAQPLTVVHASSGHAAVCPVSHPTSADAPPPLSPPRGWHSAAVAPPWPPLWRVASLHLLTTTLSRSASGVGDLEGCYLGVQLEIFCDGWGERVLCDFLAGCIIRSVNVLLFSASQSPGTEWQEVLGFLSAFRHLSMSGVLP